ncbi:MAG: CinA family protein [Chloroflexota bacterium]|nr:CinA family protein [Chloroflexota bacterium]MDE2895019.1 CinA family protein [Chloroflexota bacterium]
MAEDIAQQLVDTLAERSLTLATAETDTGGLIGHWITDIAGCSRVWIGGASPYHNYPKIDLIGVSRDLLREHGSVSEEAAVAMARGVRDTLNADIGVSETGITGPTGGSESRPVGTVWMACVGPGDRVHAERQVWDSDREGNKRLTAIRCVELVLEAAMSAADA